MCSELGNKLILKSKLTDRLTHAQQSPRGLYLRPLGGNATSNASSPSSTTHFSHDCSTTLVKE